MNHLKILLTFGLASIQLFAVAQKLDAIWIDPYGGGQGFHDEIAGIVTDSVGNTIIAGTYEGAQDFQPGSSDSLVGSRYRRPDLYFAKYDTTGKLLWLETIESDNTSSITDVELDHAGNIYLIGSASPSISLDPDKPLNLVDRRISNTHSVAFVAKYNPQGDFLWSQTAGSIYTNHPLAITFDSKNNAIVTGGFSDEIDFKPSDASGKYKFKAVRAQDAFVAKYSANGHLNWAFAIGSSSPDFGTGLVIDTNDQIIVTGYFGYTMDFDPSSKVQLLQAWSDENTFMAKYDSAGQALWGKALRGRGQMRPSSIAKSDSSHIYLTGTIEGTVDFDPSSKTVDLTSTKSRDIFLGKYTTNGTLVWADIMGSNGSDAALDLLLDSNENIYLGGYFSDTLDFAFGPKRRMKVAQKEDIFLVKYDSSGDYDWVKTFGGKENERVVSLSFDGQQNILCAGQFQDTVDFDPSNGKNILSTPTLTIPNSTGFFGRYAAQKGLHLQAFQVEDQRGGDDEITNVTHDTHGNVVVAGVFRGDARFDKYNLQDYLVSHGYHDAFVAKYDSTSKPLWASSIWGPGFKETIGGIATDTANAIYVAGEFSDSITLGNSRRSITLHSKGGTDAFLAKYGKAGRVLWAYAFGSTGNDGALDLKIGHGQKIIIAGYFEKTVDFDPTSNSQNLSSVKTNAFYVQYSPSGSCLSAKSVGNTNSTAAHLIQLGSKKQVYVMGKYQTALSLSTARGNVYLTGKDNAFVAKYDSLGKCLWAGHLDNLGDIDINSCAVDEFDAIYLTGSFERTTDFGLTTTGVTRKGLGKADMFLVKYDSSGQLKWLNTMGGSNSFYKDVGIDLAYEEPHLYVTGQYADTVDFNPNGKPSIGISSLFNQVFLARYDTSGLLDVAHPLRVMGQGNSLSLYHKAVYLGGYMRQLGKFETDSSKQLYRRALEGKDAFLGRYGAQKPCERVRSTISVAHCGAYTAPSGRVLELSGIHFDTIPQVAGCDSIIKIRFTQLRDFISLSRTSCDSILSPSGRIYYTKSGTYYDSLTNQHGCDSIYEVRFTFLKNYYRTVRISACGFYPLPNGVDTVYASGIYRDTLTSTSACDSIIAYHVAIGVPTTDSLKIVACDSFALPFLPGPIYQSGTFVDSLKSTVGGCDSVLVYEVVIHKSSFTQTSASSCGTYVSAAGRTIRSSGIYYDTLTSQNGCDSVIQQNITIYQPSFTLIQPQACDSFLSPFGKVYGQSGTYFDTLQTANGCDSVLEIRLSLHQSFRDSLYYKACDSVVIPSIARTFYASTLYTVTHSSQYGCDSVVNYFVTIPKVAASISLDSDNKTLNASPSGLNYQWYRCDSGRYTILKNERSDFLTPDREGHYAVVVSNADCDDTSACFLYAPSNIPEFGSSFSIYPNPTQNQLFVKGEVQEPTELVIMNTSGKMVLKERLTKEKRAVDLTGFSKGIYYLRLQNAKGAKVFRVVKY